jgi:hypothetical protein
MSALTLPEVSCAFPKWQSPLAPLAFDCLEISSVSSEGESGEVPSRGFLDEEVSPRGYDRARGILRLPPGQHHSTRAVREAYLTRALELFHLRNGEGSNRRPGVESAPCAYPLAKGPGYGGSSPVGPRGTGAQRPKLEAHRLPGALAGYDLSDFRAVDDAYRCLTDAPRTPYAELHEAFTFAVSEAKDLQVSHRRGSASVVGPPS